MIDYRNFDYRSFIPDSDTMYYSVLPDTGEILEVESGHLHDLYRFTMRHLRDFIAENPYKHLVAVGKIYKVRKDYFTNDTVCFMAVNHHSITVDYWGSDNICEYERGDH